MELPRHEYWSGLPFPSPGHLPNPGVKLASPELQADSLPTEPLGKTPYVNICLCICMCIYMGMRIYICVYISVCISLYIDTRGCVYIFSSQTMPPNLTGIGTRYLS